MAYIANEDLTVNFSLQVNPGGLSYDGDQGIDAVKIVPVKATKAKANSKLLCINNITLTFTGGANKCPFTHASESLVSGAGSIVAGATKVKADSQAVLLEGDTGTCVGAWSHGPCGCNLNINAAGQAKVSGL